jgi:hypothetical protein
VDPTSSNQFYPNTRIYTAARRAAGQVGKVRGAYPDLDGHHLIHQAIRRVIDTLVRDLIDADGVSGQ